MILEPTPDAVAEPLETGRLLNLYHCKQNQVARRSYGSTLLHPVKEDSSLGGVPEKPYDTPSAFPGSSRVTDVESRSGRPNHLSQNQPSRSTYDPAEISSQMANEIVCEEVYLEEHLPSGGH